MKIIQPLIIHPPIKSLNHHAMFLGFLGLEPTYNDYFTAHYVNLFYDFKLSSLDFVLPRFYTVENFLTSTMIGYDDPDIISEKYFFEMLHHSIANGYYLYANINERYIPNRSAYQKYDFQHNILVYGIDTSQRKIKSIAYTIYNEDGSLRYQPEEIDYDDFINSLANPSEGTHTSERIYKNERTYIDFVKVKPGHVFSFDVNVLLHQLDDYLNARNVIFEENSEPDCVYGIAVYEVLIKKFKSAERISLRATKLLLEHKQCMLKRMEYLISNQIISVKSYLAEYEEISQIFNKVHLLAIKHNMTNSKNIKDLLCNEIEQSVEKEKEILYRLMCDIRDTNKM